MNSIELVTDQLYTPRLNRSNALIEYQSRDKMLNEAGVTTNDLE